jgi:hypothetical protein
MIIFRAGVSTRRYLKKEKDRPDLQQSRRPYFTPTNNYYQQTHENVLATTVPTPNESRIVTENLKTNFVLKKI